MTLPGQPRLAAALGRLRSFGGHDYTLTPLTGGLLNHTYRVDGGSGSVVAHLSALGDTLLPLDHAAACANARAAAAAGVGPSVLLCDPDARISVAEWVPGRPWEPSDLDDDDNLRRVAELCRRMHAAPRFANDVDIFRLQRHYRDIVHTNGLSVPERYDDFADKVVLIEAALHSGGQGTVACHNDLVGANIVDDGSRLWFIDYEYAGNNDPCFELGYLCNEAELRPDRLEQLVTAYYGRSRPDRAARAQLFGVVADYTWVLWAAVAQTVSNDDVGLRAWATQRYERAAAAFRGPDLTRLLADARRTS